MEKSIGKAYWQTTTQTTQAMSYLQCYVVLVLLSLLLLRSLFKTSTNLPPSPPSLPLIGHLHLLLTSNYGKSLQRISSKYGPLLYLRYGFLPVVLVSSPSMAAEIFKNQDVTLSGKPKSPFDVLFGSSSFITSQYGDYWKFMKKLCMTELLGARQIQRTRGVRREELSRFVKKLLEKANKKESVDVGVELMKLTNVIICRLAMSTGHSEEDGEAEMCRRLVVQSLDLMGKLMVAVIMGRRFGRIGVWWFGKEAVDVIKRSDGFFERILKEHEQRANGETLEDKDLIDILLEAHGGAENAQLKLTRNQIKAFIMDLFVAGTSTMADTMQWVMAELINHPSVFKKVRDEIETMVGKNRLIEETDIPNLHYLQAVMKEALRLYAPLPGIPRTTIEDCKIGGYDIPAGTQVEINAYSMMRDPNVWENPDDFFPERFLEKQDQSQNEETKGFNFGYFPFGMGRRSCPGQGLALVGINVTIGAMVQCFDWKVGDGEKVNMEIGRNITTTMTHPLQCIPRLHFNPFSGDV